MKLIYVGPPPAPETTVALPQGWPAQDHDEPDAATASQKVDSGMYKREQPPRPAPAEKAPEPKEE